MEASKIAGKEKGGIHSPEKVSNKGISHDRGGIKGGLEGLGNGSGHKYGGRSIIVVEAGGKQKKSHESRKATL